MNNTSLHKKQKWEYIVQVISFLIIILLISKCHGEISSAAYLIPH